MKEYGRKLSLIEWRVQRKKEILSANPERMENFLYLLKNQPDIVLHDIRKHTHSDIMDAIMSGRLDCKVVTPSKNHDQEVLEAYKKEFLREDVHKF